MTVFCLTSVDFCFLAFCPTYAFVGRASRCGAEICWCWAENGHVNLPLPLFLCNWVFLL